MNIIRHVVLAGAAAVSLVSLGGCADDYAYGGGVQAGYAPAYGGYYDGYYGAYGDQYAGYGYPGYYGWYGGFYYPGSGFYVYDRYRRPYRWNGDQRRYWSGQQRSFGGGAGVPGFRSGRNWNGFDRGNGNNSARPAGQAFRGGGMPAGSGRVGGMRGGGPGGGRHR